jgi:hypothetical protein
MADETEKTGAIDPDALKKAERAVQAELDSRVQKEKAPAEASGKGPEKPEKGVNPDG